jgi:hypothetical protein
MRLLIGFSALCLAACSADTGSGPILIETTKIALFPDTPERLDVGVLEYRGGLVLSSDDERFGGLSGMEVEGNRVLMISDSAYWLTATLEFDDAGVLTDFSNAFYAPMLDANGVHLVDRAADAEGLASLENGAYAVSFEREHRIDRYDIAPDWSGIAIATPTPMPAPPGTDRLRDNAGIEGLASADYGLWAGVESPIIDGRPHTLWLMPHDGEATGLPYPGEASFGITGLDRGPDGEIYLLERIYVRDVGNTVRIMRFDEFGLETEALRNNIDTLAILTPDMTVDNIEGIAIGEVNGEMRLFVVSDDNYNPGQRTLLLSFALPQ